MINDAYRGSAWTVALLGLCAKEIHLCGDARAAHLVARIVQKTGDILEFREYKRRNKLEFIQSTYDMRKNLKAGDCIIAFDVADVHRYRKEINSITGGDNCGMIYGKLPPEIKVSQAQRFNDGTFKYLVATDAIGMGLNLHIKRIIFSSVHKMNQNGERSLILPHHLKQIAGRAGRLEEEGGQVLGFNRGIGDVIFKCLKGVNDSVHDPKDIKDLNLVVENTDGLKEIVIEQSQETSPAPLMTDATKEQTKVPLTQPEGGFTKEMMEINRAIVFPSFQHIVDFSGNLEAFLGKEISFAELVKKFDSIAKVGGMYNIQNFETIVGIATAIQGMKLNLYERYVFCMAPINAKAKNFNSYDPNVYEEGSFHTDYICRQFLRFVKEYSTFGEVELGINFEKDIEFIRQKPLKAQFTSLETIFNVCEAYIWLSFKFRNEFFEKELAIKVKKEIIKEMNGMLKISPDLAFVARTVEDKLFELPDMISGLPKIVYDESSSQKSQSAEPQNVKEEGPAPIVEEASKKRKYTRKVKIEDGDEDARNNADSTSKETKRRSRDSSTKKAEKKG